jgi:hypothetical protein
VALPICYAGDPAAKRFQLFTGHRSESNLRLYRSRGYVPVSREEVGPRLTLVTLEKETSAGAYVASA